MAIPSISVRRILRHNGPRLVRDSVGPVAAFYLGFRTRGLLLGIVLATIVALALYLLERRRGRAGAVARISLGFILLQSLVGFLTRSVTLYFLQPVLIDLVMGVVFGGSAVIRRSIIGAAARDAFPFPPDVAESVTFRRVFGRLSYLWGAYFLVRAGVRLLALRTGRVETILLVNTISDVPFVIGLIGFAIWYSVHAFRHSAEWGEAIQMLESQPGAGVEAEPGER